MSSATLTQTEQPTGRLPYKWIVMIVMIIGSFLSVLDMTVINNSLPRLQVAFGANLDTLQWVVTAYTLVQGVVTPLTAYLVSRLGGKWLFILALTFFTLGSTLCGFAWNLPALLVFRVVQAIGGATLFPLALTLIFGVFPIKQRGLAMGVMSISSMLAPAIGPT